MSRPFNQHTIAVLSYLYGKNYVPIKELRQQCAAKKPVKDFYNCLFRLQQQELAEKIDNKIAITEEGKKLLSRLAPERDGVWKLVVFDIPEKHKYVRTVLRAKLKQLHFQKWQNSIWISPYKIDEEIADELAALGKKFFVRLIKTTDINHSEDLEKMFESR